MDIWKLVLLKWKMIRRERATSLKAIHIKLIFIYSQGVQSRFFFSIWVTLVIRTKFNKCSSMYESHEKWLQSIREWRIPWWRISFRKNFIQEKQKSCFVLWFTLSLFDEKPFSSLTAHITILICILMSLYSFVYEYNCLLPFLFSAMQNFHMHVIKLFHFCPLISLMLICLLSQPENLRCRKNFPHLLQHRMTDWSWVHSIFMSLDLLLCFYDLFLCLSIC